MRCLTTTITDRRFARFAYVNSRVRTPAVTGLQSKFPWAVFADHASCRNLREPHLRFVRALVHNRKMELAHDRIDVYVVEIKWVRLYCVDAKGGLAIISRRAAENGSPCDGRALRAA